MVEYINFKNIEIKPINIKKKMIVFNFLMILIIFFYFILSFFNVISFYTFQGFTIFTTGFSILINLYVKSLCKEVGK